jgi:uncharacterized protein involved in exopolysaccharide biosynthesis
MSSQFDIGQIKGLIRRRKKTFIFTSVAIFLVSATVALVLPPVYQSESKIIIEGQQIPQDYVKTTITGYAEERLELIKQQIMSRSKLLEIVDRFNLYPDIKARYTTEEVLARMREAIMLKTISADIVDQKTGRPGVATIAFTLSYEGKEPNTVQKVSNALASLFLEEDMKARERMTSTTTNFLEEESEKFKEQMLLLEKQISDFKGMHMGELPQHNVINLQTLDRLERELERIESRIRSLQEKQVFLKGQLAMVDPLRPVVTDQGKMAGNPQERLKGLRLQLIGLQAKLSDKHPDIKRIKREIEELEAQVGRSDDSVEKVRRLKELETQLADTKGKLGPKHPDVIRLTKEVEVLSAQVDKLVTQKTATDIADDNPDNPAYINLKIQLTTNEMDLKTTIQDKEQIKKELSEYQKKMENAPLVEKEYIALTRDYETAKHKYQELSSKLLTAKVAQGMEETQRGERFTITDPAPFPEKPYKPKRIAIILIGFVLAFGAGVGLAAAQEAFDFSVKSADEISELAGIPVLSVLPYMQSASEKRNKRIKAAVLAGTAIGLVVVALIVVDRMYMPLDILWIKVQQRMTAELPFLSPPKAS